MRSHWRDGDRTRSVEVTRLETGHYRVRVDGAELEIAVEPLGEGRARLAVGGEHTVVEVTVVDQRRFVRLGAMDFVFERRARSRGPSAGAPGLEAPMPGVVTRVLVAVGDAVRRGQPLLAVEAMKMEHVIRAPRDGRVVRLAAEQGQMVNGGVALVELAEPP